MILASGCRKGFNFSFSISFILSAQLGVNVICSLPWEGEGWGGVNLFSQTRLIKHIFAV